MEAQCGRSRGVIPSLGSPHLNGTPKLKNFTIPRKKRASGSAVLEPCAKESRDYTLIESTLSDLMLETGKETCKWEHAKLVHNDDLLREFAEKRSEMRLKGRHLRETEERFCFLVASDQETTQIYQHGLKVGKTNQHSLGKPSHGVYLFRHVDVALKNPDCQPAAGKNMIIFKVLFGKVKKVTPSSVETGTQDPTLAFDCHMSRDTVSPRDSLSLQILGSSVFLFDYNENQDLTTRPRQCLPYAVIPIASVSLPTSASIPASPTELPPKVLKHGPGETLKAFVLAERRGKGQSATVKFKHFGPQGPHVTEQMHHEAGVERKTDYLHTPSYVPYVPQLQSVNHYQFGPWAGYTPALEENIQYGNTEVPPPAFLHQSQISDPRVPNVSFKEGEPKISTIVYSSKTVKDPRLSGRELGDPNRIASAVQQILGTTSESNRMNAQKIDLSSSQLQANGCRGTPAQIGTYPQNAQHAYTIETSEAEPCGIPATHKSEKLPSLKLFKVKFQKYSLYFKMSEAERIKHVWSRTDLDLDQKNLMLDRIHFYEHYYEKYKRGLLFSQVRKTDQSVSRERTNERNVYPTGTDSTSKHIDEKMEQMCTKLRKTEQSVSNSTLAQGQFDTSRSREDIATPDCLTSAQIKHVRPEPTALHRIELEHDVLPNGHTVNEEQSVDGLSSNSQQPAGLPQVPWVHPKPCGDLKSPIQVNTQREEVGEVPHELPESSMEGLQISLSLTETESIMGCLAEEEVKEVSIGHTERKEEDPREDITFVKEGEFLDVGMCEEVCTMNEMEISMATTSSPNQGGQIDLKITDSDGTWKEEETLKNFKNSDKSENCRKLKTDVSEVSANTIYSLLYNRLQFSQPLPNSAPAHCKPYLNPRCRDQTTASTEDNFVNWNIQAASNYNDCDGLHVKKRDLEKHAMLGITIKSNVRDLNDIMKPMTLSERFSLLSCSQGWQPLSGLLKDSMLADRNKQCVTGSISSKTEEPNCHFNVKLVKLLTQKYNEFQLRTSRRYRKLREVSDFKSTIHRISHRRSKRPTSNSTLKKAFILKRRYFKTLPRVVRKTKLSRRVTQNRKEGVLRKEPSHTTETRKEAELEQSNKSVVTGSEGSAVEISYSHTLIKCVSSTAHNEPTDQSLKSEGQKSGSYRSIDSPSVMSNTHDSGKDVEMEGVTNQDKDEVLQKVPDVVNESGSVEEVKCRHNKSPTANAISTKDYLSHNLNPGSGIQNDGVLKNTNNHIIASHHHVEKAIHLQIQLNAKDKKSLVDSNVDNNSNPSPVEQKIQFDTDVQEVKLISKLRNYLTKFETTVKLQEPLDGISSEPSQQTLSTPSKDDTVQMSLLLGSQSTEVLNPGFRYSVAELKINLPNPGPPGSSLLRQSVTSTSQQNILPADIRDPTATKCAPGIPGLLDETTQSSLTSGPKPVSRLSPDSTTTLGIVSEKAIQHLLIELSRPRLPPELQKMQRNIPDGDHHIQSTNQINVQWASVITPAAHNTKTHSRQNGVAQQVKVKKPEAAQGPTLYAKTVNTISFQRHYNTEDISNLLKEADCAVTIDVLLSLLHRSKDMLQYFISNFERDQGIAVQYGIITRDVILERYLHHPPAPYDLKYEALSSFLELQMMVEAKQFMENKISFLTGKPTFRSLLWYDPSLYGELFKGRVGYQQQSCVYTSFQQGLAIEGYSKLQNYHLAVTTLNQQLKMVPATSYYLYLKSKREKLEIEAALQNINDFESFFLSVPISSMINFGDSPERLERLQNRVISFVETPAAKMPGAFDVGKAEHLSIICRFLQEKMNCVKTCKAISSPVSWFGLEHLLYDASKVLVSRDAAARKSSQDNALKFQSVNSNLSHGAPSPWLPVVNTPTQMPQSHGRLKAAGQLVDTKGNPLRRATTERKQYLKKRKSIGPVETTPLEVKRRHSHPVTGDNNEHARTYMPPQMNQMNLGQFQPGLHSNNLLKQHAALWRRRTQDNPPPPLPHPPPQLNSSPVPVHPGRQSHSQIRALLLSKQQNNISHQQPAPSRPSPANPVGIPAMQKLVPPPLTTTETPLYLPHVFPPPYEGVIHHLAGKNPPQYSEVFKEPKNPFALGPVPSLQLPPSLRTPRPALSAPHSSAPFTASPDNAAQFPEHAPLNYPFFVLNGCTYTSATSDVPNKAVPNDSRLNPQKS